MERSLWQLPRCQMLHFTVKHLNVDAQVFPVIHPNCLKEGLFMCFFHSRHNPRHDDDAAAVSDFMWEEILRKLACSPASSGLHCLIMPPFTSKGKSLTAQASRFGRWVKSETHQVIVVSALKHLDAAALLSDRLSIVLGGCAQLYTNTPLTLWKTQLTAPVDEMRTGHRALFTSINTAQWSMTPKKVQLSQVQNYLNLPNLGPIKWRPSRLTLGVAPG